MKTIDNILEKNESLSNRSALLIQAPIYGALAFYGEHLQALSASHIRPYDWWTGHLSDIFGISVVCELTHALFIRSGLNKSEISSNLKYSSIGIASLFTLLELNDINDPAYKFDIQDIACSWAGAGIAYFGTKILSKQINNFLKKRNKKLEKNNLEALK